MKLYIWNDVLCDYTCGVLFALAENVDEARELIFNKYIKDHGYKDDGNVIENMRTHFECNTKEPDEIIDVNNKYAFWLWGGG